MKINFQTTFIIFHLIIFAGVNSAFSSDDAAAGEVIGEVIAVESSGWVNRLNGTVKQTVKVGDAVYEGDRFDVKYGNYIQVALDSNPDNILHLEQNSVMQLFKHGKVNVEITKGSVIALLDNIKKTRGFNIASPTAVASVRGTYYQVKTNGNNAEITTFQGNVVVTGRHKNGDWAYKQTGVYPARKTQINSFGVDSDKPMILTEKEFEKINQIILKTNNGRKLLDYQEALAAAKALEEKEANRPDYLKKLGSDILY